MYGVAAAWPVNSLLWEARLAALLFGAVGSAARLTLASFCPTNNKVLLVEIYTLPKERTQNEGQSVISCWVPSIVLCNSGKGRSSKHRRFNCGSSRLPTRPDLPSAVVCVNLPARGDAHSVAQHCVAVMCQPRGRSYCTFWRDRRIQSGPRWMRLSERDKQTCWPGGQHVGVNTQTFSAASQLSIGLRQLSQHERALHGRWIRS